MPHFGRGRRRMISGGRKTLKKIPNDKSKWFIKEPRRQSFHKKKAMLFYILFCLIFIRNKPPYITFKNLNKNRLIKWMLKGPN